MNKKKILVNLIILVSIFFLCYYLGFNEITCVEPHYIIKSPKAHLVNTQDIPPETKVFALIAFTTIVVFFIINYL